MIKNVFAYCKFNKKIASECPHRYEFLSAVSEDEKHYFEFTINQNDYRTSVKECWNTFEAFCKNDCGLDDCRNCNVIFTDDISANPHLHRYDFIDDYDTEICLDIEQELGACDWCCCLDLAFEYRDKCTHIKKPLTFAQFKKQNGYSVKNEPYATKRMYAAYKAQIDKSEYTPEEIANIIEYIHKHAYGCYSRRLFEEFRLTESLHKLALCDKPSFDACMDFLIEYHKKKRSAGHIRKCDYKFKTYVQYSLAETYYYEKLNSPYVEEDEYLSFWEHPKSEIFHSLKNAEWLKTFLETEIHHDSLYKEFCVIKKKSRK